MAHLARELVTSFLLDTELGEGRALLDRAIEHPQPIAAGRASELVRRFLHVHEVGPTERFRWSGNPTRVPPRCGASARHARALRSTIRSRTTAAMWRS